MMLIEVVDSKDKSNNLSTRSFVVDKVGPELMELITKYEPEVLWSDGDWEVSIQVSTIFMFLLYSFL